MPRPRLPQEADVVVVGAGFGGLGAALTLAEAGARVVLLEALHYPGGCASTFSRAGARWEAGATIFVGFQEGQLFRRWIDRHGLDVPVRQLDPALVLHVGDRRLPVWSDKPRFVDALCAEPGADPAAIRAFFAAQSRIADPLWALFDDPERLPPWGPAALAGHLRRLPSLLPVARWVGRSASDVLSRYGLADWQPLRAWVDATCQITVQVPAAEAEAPFALAAIDYLFRGPVHVEGGIGALASALAGAVEARGGAVALSTPARRLTREGGRWVVDTRRGPVSAPHVVANLLPGALQGLLEAPAPRLAALQARVQTGWGAAMLYLLVADDGTCGSGHHQLVAEPGGPLADGGHALVSIGGPQTVRGERVRAVTVSGHLTMGGPDQAERVERAQARLRALVARHLPELRVITEMTASPRTFEAFTGRTDGFVGGIPRRTGLAAYRGLLQGPVAPGLHLVGDTVFPGQSTLATAIGGHRAAARVLRAG